MLIAVKLEYVEESRLAPVLALTAEVGRMLSGLTRSLNKNRRGKHLIPGT